MTGRFKADVTNELAVRLPVDTYIDHHRTGFHPFTGNDPGFTDRYHQDLCPANFDFDIDGKAMTDRHGGSSQQELERQRTTDMIRRANHHDHLALGIDANTFNQVRMPKGVHGRSRGIRWTKRPTV